MGVVRRNGDWRLEKREEGVYEITHRGNVRVRVLTPEISAGTAEPTLDTTPVRKVDSYPEAEGLFEELANTDQRGGLVVGREPAVGGVDVGLPGSNTSQSEGPGTASNVEENLPPGVIGLALVTVGGLVLSTVGFAPRSPAFLFSAALVAGGVAVFGWAVVLYRTRGLAEAVEFVTTVDGDAPDGSSEDEPEKTPPPSEKQKNELIFDRAEQKCEWCEERFDHPHVHHIVPRREGGPNDPENLIVLCPNCHEKADRGTIPRSKLEAKVKRLARG